MQFHCLIINCITKAVICAVLASCSVGIPARLGLCTTALPVLVGWGCLEPQSIVVKIVLLASSSYANLLCQTSFDYFFFLKKENNLSTYEWAIT